MLQDKEVVLERAGTLRIKQLPTSTALRFSVALGKLAVPIAEGFDFSDQDNSKRQISFEAVDIARRVMNVMDEQRTPDMVRDLVKASVVQPPWDDGGWYETRFAANFKELFELLKEIIQFNYGGVLELLGKTMSGTEEDTSPSSSEEKSLGMEQAS